MTQDDTKVLADSFAHLRTQEVAVSDSLMDRIMLDADQVLAEAEPAAGPSVAAGGPRFGAMVLDAIGGWPSFGGLAAATVAGFWIGVAPPDALSALTEAYVGGTIEVPVLDGTILSVWEG